MVVNFLNLSNLVWASVIFHHGELLPTAIILDSLSSSQLCIFLGNSLYELNVPHQNPFKMLATALSHFGHRETVVSLRAGLAGHRPYQTFKVPSLYLQRFICIEFTVNTVFTMWYPYKTLYST